MTTKRRTCTRCSTTKLTPNDFYTSGKKRNGTIRWKTWCKQCELETQKIKRYTDPEYREYYLIQSAGWQKKNPARYYALLVAWREKNPDYRNPNTDKKQEVIDLLVRDQLLREERRNAKRS